MVYISITNHLNVPQKGENKLTLLDFGINKTTILKLTDATCVEIRVNDCTVYAR